MLDCGMHMGFNDEVSLLHRLSNVLANCQSQLNMFCLEITALDLYI